MNEPDLFDICARKHGGNPESQGAFQAIKDRLTGMQLVVLGLIQRSGEHGMTCDEISKELGRGENVYSGRITELKIAGKITKCGRRPTRSGCTASVWKAV